MRHQIIQLLKRTLIVLFAASLVILATLPLAETEWADSMRNRPQRGSGRHEVERREDLAGGIEVDSPRKQGTRRGRETGRRGHREATGVLRYFAPFLKALMLIGIPGFLTVVFLKIGKRIVATRQA